MAEQTPEPLDGIREAVAEFRAGRTDAYGAVTAIAALLGDKPTPAADVDHGPYIAAIARALGRVTWLTVTYWHAGDPAPRGGYIELAVVGRSRPLGLGWDEEHGWTCGLVGPAGGMDNPMDMGLGLVPPPAVVVQAVRLRLALPAAPGRYRDAEEEDPELEVALAAYHRDEQGGVTTPEGDSRG